MLSYFCYCDFELYMCLLLNNFQRDVTNNEHLSENSSVVYVWHDMPDKQCRGSNPWSATISATDSSAMRRSIFSGSCPVSWGPPHASSSYFLGEATWPTRSPRDCTDSTFPHESSSNYVCWLAGASTGLHLLILQTTSSRLVQLEDGQIYDQRLPASCAFRAPRLW